jgi:Flp pilus assembly pilin Flp
MDRYFAVVEAGLIATVIALVLVKLAHFLVA